MKCFNIGKKDARSIAFNYYCLPTTIHEMAYLEFVVPSAE
jgi:hypothetical protein